MIIAAVGGAEPDRIALIDVAEPSRARVREVLWTRGKRPDVAPYHPVYSPATGRCVFIGSGTRGKGLYSFRRGPSGPPQRVEREGYDKEIVDLALFRRMAEFLAPFTSDRPGDRRHDMKKIL